MKNPQAKKIFGQVSIAHGTIILLTILLSSFHGCTPKQKDVTFIDLAGGPAPAPAPAPASEPEPEAAPEPEIKSKPEPKPEPKPEKKTMPKPVVTNTPPKKVETNEPPKKAEVKKPAVTNAPSKPKTLEQRLADVRKGGKPVAAKPGAKPGPQLDLSGVRNALNSSATSSSGSGFGTSTGSGSGSGGMYSPFAWYYDQVKQQMYMPGVWQQPLGVPIGTTATTTVRVERDGTLSSKSITRRSGNAQFDQSVQNALNATTRLPVPPADLPDRNIVIEFVLSDSD